MKFEIKHKYSSKVLFSIEIGSLQLAVEAAVKSKADLSGADLYGADLSGADLYGADLSGADLYGANLSGADLSSANLYGANLSGANLYGADLSRANLSRANLSSADLYGANLHGYISIGPIGSRKAYLWTRWEEKGFMVKTGCFNGTLAEFKKAVKEKHTSGEHKSEYMAAIKLLEARMKSTEEDFRKSQKDKK